MWPGTPATPGTRLLSCCPRHLGLHSVSPRLQRASVSPPGRVTCPAGLGISSLPSEGPEHVFRCSRTSPCAAYVYVLGGRAGRGTALTPSPLSLTSRGPTPRPPPGPGPRRGRPPGCPGLSSVRLQVCPALPVGQAEAVTLAKGHGGEIQRVPVIRRRLAAGDVSSHGAESAPPAPCAGLVDMVTRAVVLCVEVGWDETGAARQSWCHKPERRHRSCLVLLRPLFSSAVSSVK